MGDLFGVSGLVHECSLKLTSPINGSQYTSRSVDVKLDFWAKNDKIIREAERTAVFQIEVVPAHRTFHQLRRIKIVPFATGMASSISFVSLPSGSYSVEFNLVYNNSYSTDFCKKPLLVSTFDVLPCCSVKVKGLDGRDSTTLLSVNAAANQTTVEAVEAFARQRNASCEPGASWAERCYQLYSKLEQRRIDIMGDDEPAFYYEENEAQGNIVPEMLQAMGYRRVMAVNLKNIRFKFVTWPKQISWPLFVVGRDVVNSIQGIAVIDRKVQLISHLCSSSHITLFQDLMQRAIEAYRCTSLCIDPATFWLPTFNILNSDDCTKWHRYLQREPSKLWLSKGASTFGGGGLILLNTTVKKREYDR